jgi:hypothetical protein
MYICVVVSFCIDGLVYLVTNRLGSWVEEGIELYIQNGLGIVSLCNIIGMSISVESSSF